MAHKPSFAAYYRWLILTHHLDIEIQADSILDVGCDDGHFLSQQAGRLKVGVDLQPRVSPNGGMSVVQADGCMLPFADESFSAICAFEVIEHVPDDNAFVTSLTRVLVAGGRLWLSTPSNTWNLFLPWITRRAMCGWGHQRVGYDPDDLAARFPLGYRVQVTRWNALSFRFLYALLRVLRVLSPALARLVARFCFEIDRRLPEGCDYVFLEVVHDNDNAAES